MTIYFANLPYQHALYQEEIESAVLKVMRRCDFIMGEEVSKLESSLERFTGAKHAITCSSGTDALLLALMALDIRPGDEIITTPFTFIATAETIARLGAVPVFVDIDETTFNLDPARIEAAITEKTKAIIPVNLYGQPADLDEIQAIASQYDLKIVIDGAQSFGSTYKGVADSALGDISCTSFFPAKPLGCYGDGGAVFTNNDNIAEKIRSLRLHGQTKRYYHRYIGIGGRLDTIQAAVLNIKLRYYPKDLALRQGVANGYLERLKEKGIILPRVKEDRTSAWAQYSIRINNREAMQKRLHTLGIPTAVHYPMPLHLQKCFAYLRYNEGNFPISEKVANEILSLPINPFLTDAELSYIATNVIKEKI